MSSIFSLTFSAPLAALCLLHYLKVCVRVRARICVRGCAWVVCARAGGLCVGVCVCVCVRGHGDVFRSTRYAVHYVEQCTAQYQTAYRAVGCKCLPVHSLSFWCLIHTSICVHLSGYKNVTAQLMAMLESTNILVLTAVDMRNSPLHMATSYCFVDCVIQGCW